MTIHTETTCFSVYFLLIIYLNCPLKKAHDSMTKYNDVSTFDPVQAYPTHSPSPLENPHFFYTPRSKMTENMLETSREAQMILSPIPSLGKNLVSGMQCLSFQHSNNQTKLVFFLACKRTGWYCFFKIVDYI